jgi:hypothetical protein
MMSTQAEQPAQAMGTTVPVPPAPGRRHGQPHGVCEPHPIDGLQHEVEREAEFQLGDHQQRRLAGAQSHHVAATQFGLHGVAEPFEECLHGRVQRALAGYGLRDGLGPSVRRYRARIVHRRRLGCRLAGVKPMCRPMRVATGVARGGCPAGAGGMCRPESIKKERKLRIRCNMLQCEAEIRRK